METLELELPSPTKYTTDILVGERYLKLLACVMTFENAGIILRDARGPEAGDVEFFSEGNPWEDEDNYGSSDTTPAITEELLEAERIKALQEAEDLRTVGIWAHVFVEDNDPEAEDAGFWTKRYPQIGDLVSVDPKWWATYQAKHRGLEDFEDRSSVNPMQELNRPMPNPFGMLGFYDDDEEVTFYLSWKDFMDGQGWEYHEWEKLDEYVNCNEVDPTEQWKLSLTNHKFRLEVKNYLLQESNRFFRNTGIFPKVNAESINREAQRFLIRACEELKKTREDRAYVPAVPMTKIVEILNSFTLEQRLEIRYVYKNPKAIAWHEKGQKFLEMLKGN